MDNTKYQVALTEAAQKNSYNELKSILEQGLCSPNQKDLNGVPAICLAAFRGNLKCIKLLIQQGADINATDTFGRSALNTACGQFGDNCIKTVKYLIDKGADINLPDQWGETGFRRIIERFGELDIHIDIIRQCIERGADIHIANSDGESILDVMQAKKYQGILDFYSVHQEKMALNKHIDVNLKANHENSLLRL